MASRRSGLSRTEIGRGWPGASTPALAGTRGAREALRATPTASSVSSGSTQLLVIQDALAPDGTPGGAPSSTSDAFIPYTGYSYGASTGVSVSAVVTATAPGSVTSAVSAWSAGATNYNAGTYGLEGVHIDGVALWISWTGLAPSFNVYTSADLGSETEAAVVSGNGLSAGAR